MNCNLTDVERSKGIRCRNWNCSECNKFFAIDGQDPCKDMPGFSDWYGREFPYCGDRETYTHYRDCKRAWKEAVLITEARTAEHSTAEVSPLIKEILEDVLDVLRLFASKRIDLLKHRIREILGE